MSYVSNTYIADKQVLGLAIYRNPNGCLAAIHIKRYDTYFVSIWVGETGIGHAIYGNPEYIFVGDIGNRYIKHIY